MTEGNSSNRSIAQWVLAALFFFTGFSANAESSSQNVQRDATAVLKAFHFADLDTVMRYTHPKIISMLGGPKPARETMAKALKSLKSQGMKLKSLSIPHAPRFLRGGKRRFVFVPTLSVFSFDGKKIESLNYLLGILDDGAKQWKYLDGAKLNSRKVRALFPGFPRGVTFPKRYMEVR